MAGSRSTNSTARSFPPCAATFAGETAHHIDRFVASQTIVMSLEGIPAFYIHALLATPNDLEAVAGAA